MRDLIDIINEAYGEERVRFYKNPTVKMAARVMERSYYKELKATYDTSSDTLFLWDANGGAHDSMNVKYEISGINLDIFPGLINIRIPGHEGRFIADNRFVFMQYNVDYDGMDEEQAKAALAAKLMQEIMHSRVPATFPGFTIEPEFIYI